jgi:SpoVK/Ycf46/Vps4 family AAA+-type ATPase
MNQELLLRLFRSIEGDKNDDVVKVAELIINDEKKKGHEKLADKLESILRKNIADTQSFRGDLKQLLPKGVSIPTDKRNHLPLALFLERDELRHHMILRPETESKISRIEKEFAAKERLALHGLKYRQKVLIYGAPGCGKSMSAERIAWNLGLPFLKVRFDVIISSYLGETASNLAKLFEGIKNYPCVLLFDEFDVIAKTRNNSHDIGEMHRVVNILLTLLEEYDAPGIFIATTNIENALDSALFRRFDDIIEMPKPNIEEIVRLLKLTLSSVQKSKNLNWEKIAEMLQGFSAAIVVKIANDAAKFSVIGNENEIQNEHFDRSFQENQFYIK